MRVAIVPETSPVLNCWHFLHVDTHTEGSKEWRENEKFASADFQMIREVSDKIICILFKMGPLGRPQAPRGRDSKSSSSSSGKKCLLIQSVQHHLLKEG